MRRSLRTPYFIFSLLFLLAVTAQVALVGLALFWRSSVWEVHVGVGHLLGFFPLVMLVLALVGRFPFRLYTALLFVGVLVQTEIFVLIRELSGIASSFHPVLAMVLFWGGAVLARRSLALEKEPEIVPAGAVREERLANRAKREAAPSCDPVTGLGC